MNKTTGFKPDVLAAIVARCEKEDREWNDIIDELLRKGLGVDVALVPEHKMED